MSTTGALTGGCLCGRLRYRVTSPPIRVTHCHCSMCRKASGAPVVTWINLPKDGFAVTQGELSSYQSSPGCQRGFCPNCGGQITFLWDGWPDQVDVTLGSLDKPNALPADNHIWTDSRISWLRLDEHLPGHPGNNPDA